MKIRAVGLAAVIGLAVLCFGLPAFGQVVTAQLTGVSGVISVDPTTGSADVYGGLYYGTINGGSTIPIICDDANDDVSIGLTWPATEMSATQIAANLGSVLFGTNATAPPGVTIGVVGYAEVAGLVETMFAPGTTLAEQGALSTAIWAITSGDTLGLTGTALTYYDNAIVEFGTGSLSSQNLNLASVLGATAALALDGNLTLITPHPVEHGISQEYWTLTVPEGGSTLLYLLLAGMACFGAMRFSSRSEFGKRAA